MSLHIQRARCKISNNKNLTGLQCKLIIQICKILMQYLSCLQELVQKFFEEGVRKCAKERHIWNYVKGNFCLKFLAFVTVTPQKLLIAWIFIVVVVVVGYPTPSEG